jgi:hypothetical protein
LDRYRDSHGDLFSNGFSFCDTHSDRDSHRRPYADGDCNLVGDGNAYRLRDIYGNAHSDRDAASAYGDSDADL